MVRWSPPQEEILADPADFGGVRRPRRTVTDCGGVCQIKILACEWDAPLIFLAGSGEVKSYILTGNLFQQLCCRIKKY